MCIETQYPGVRLSIIVEIEHLTQPIISVTVLLPYDENISFSITSFCFCLHSSDFELN